MSTEKKPVGKKKKRAGKKTGLITKSTTKPATKSAGDSTAGSAERAEESTLESENIPASTSFEAALGELQTIVESLESGEQALEESLMQFERGISLARFCQNNLQAAEQKIMLLSGDDDVATDDALEAFESSESVED